MTITDHDPIPFDTWDPPTIDVGPAAIAPGSSGCEVRWVHRDGKPIVLKRGTGRARASLRREATVLKALAGAPVVAVDGILDDFDHTELALVDAGRRTLADSSALSATMLRRALIATCVAVSAIHARGWAHGSIEPEHAVLSGRGQVTLCSLGRAVSLADQPDGARKDLDALRELLRRTAARPAEVSGWGERRRWNRVRRRVRRVCDAESPRNARDLTDRVRSAVDVNQSRRRALPASVSAAFALLVVLVLTVGRSRSEEDPAIDASNCPPIHAGRADVNGDGCGEAIAIDGPVVDVDGVRFRVGVDGDVVAVGDWDCDGTATPTVLRPATGELLRYPRWARNKEVVPAELVGTVADARSIRSVHRSAGGPTNRERGGRTCDDLVVGLADGSERPFPLDN